MNLPHVPSRIIIQDLCPNMVHEIKPHKKLEKLVMAINLDERYVSIVFP